MLAFLYNTPELCLFSSIFFLCDILIGLLLFFPLFDRTLTVSWNTSIYMNVFSNRSLYSGWKVTSGVCFYLKHSWCFEYQVLKICPNFFFPGQDVCLKMTGWVFCSKSSLLSFWNLVIKLFCVISDILVFYIIKKRMYFFKIRFVIRIFLGIFSCTKRHQRLSKMVSLSDWNETWQDFSEKNLCFVIVDTISQNHLFDSTRASESQQYRQTKS